MVAGGEHGSVKTLGPWRAAYDANRIFKRSGMVGSFRISAMFMSHPRRCIKMTSGWKAMADEDGSHPILSAKHPIRCRLHCLANRSIVRCCSCCGIISTLGLSTSVLMVFKVR
jgi:hypothetical protein